MVAQSNKGSFNDRTGKTVGWLCGSLPKSSLTPLTFLTSLQPLAAIYKGVKAAGFLL